MRSAFNWLSIAGFLFIITSCSDDDQYKNPFKEKVYVTAQGFDQVNILTVTEEFVIDDQEIVPFNYIENMPDHPHFVEIDEENGVWFTTVINSGYVVMVDIETNETIDSVAVGDSPALMAHHSGSRKLYVSRMMPMGEMGSNSNVIQILNYTADQLVIEGEYDLPSPSPHGIDISEDGRFLFVASTTTDWVFKIDTETHEISELNIGVENPFESEINYLKPIQVRLMNNVLFVSCSAKLFYNPTTNQNEPIPGKIIAINSENFEFINEYSFEWLSSPWHITTDPETNEIFVVLAGDTDYENSAGVACLGFDGEAFTEKWNTYESIFQTLHGIVLSENSNNLYVSGRGDGHLHILNRTNGSHIQSVPIQSMMDMGGMAMGAMLGGIAIRTVEKAPE